MQYPLVPCVTKFFWSRSRHGHDDLPWSRSRQSRAVTVTWPWVTKIISGFWQPLFLNNVYCWWRLEIPILMETCEKNISLVERKKWKNFNIKYKYRTCDYTSVRDCPWLASSHGHVTVTNFSKISVTVTAVTVTVTVTTVTHGGHAGHYPQP
jgi:hypothetical protein